MRLLLLVPLLLASAVAPVRTVDHNLLVSDQEPAISIQVDPSLTYVGSFHFQIHTVAAGDRFVWVQATPEKRVQKLVIVQLEGYLEGKGQYNYSPLNVTHLGENDYNSNGFFYDDSDYGREHPGNEATKTREFLEQRGYSLDHEQSLYRFFRALPDRQNEILIFYIQPMSELGLKMSEASPEQDTPREKELKAQQRERALASFKIVKG